MSQHPYRGRRLEVSTGTPSACDHPGHILILAHSQGAALIAAAISDLTPTTRQLVKGVALFGYTKNEQNGGRVPGYPAEQTKVFCAPGDLVCEGELIVTVEHFSYGPLAEDEGSKFLSGRI
jgi:cutinase